MRRRLLLRTVVCSCFVATAGTLASAGGPSAEDLIALAPVFSSGDRTCKGVELSGTITAAEGVAPLKFRAVYRAPDRHALVVRDGVDDTPIFWAADRKVIVYDPVRPAVLYSTGPRTEFILFADEGVIRLGWGVATSKEKPSGITVTVKGLFDGPFQGDEVVKTGDGTYRLTRVKSEWLSVVAHVDTNRKQPYTKVEVYSGPNSILMTLDKIVVGEAPGDEAFAIPTKEQLAAKLTVQECLEDGFIKSIKGVTLIAQSMYVRMAANRPELREMSLRSGFTTANMDWDAVKKNDAVYSQVLKDLIAAKPKGGVPDAAR